MVVSLGRWWRCVTCWRVVTLVLVALPQVLYADFPELPHSDAGTDHSEATVVVSETVAGADYPQARPLLEQLLVFVAESGLVMLIPAVVFALPRRHVRRGTRWAAVILAVLGTVDGYLGMKALEHNDTAGWDLLLPSPFYLLAAGALVLSQRQHRPEAPETANSAPTK
ncbi:hypothetical protein [Nocardia coubleae]|uniref:Uncharacterized protein n=1 Tax=Nocardia coubleae TaxID=356147 RepID=A0A846W049_9NOCA|nr:hypothetical protein [Nocardia coubleae]NKX86078.1 hypothetical protein [Nocardia coubleae]